MKICQPLVTVIFLFLLFQQEVNSTYNNYSPVSFNLRNCTITSTNQWTKVRIGLKGGTAPYEYVFDQHPENWRYAKEEIFIPRQFLKKNQKFPCRMRVFDKDRNQARATIVILIQSQKVWVSDIVYSYDKIFDDKFFNSGGFTGRPTLKDTGNNIQPTIIIKNVDPDQYLGVHKRAVENMINFPFSNKDDESTQDDKQSVPTKNTSTAVNRTAQGAFSLTNFLTQTRNQNFGSSIFPTFSISTTPVKSQQAPIASTFSAPSRSSQQIYSDQRNSNTYKWFGIQIPMNSQNTQMMQNIQTVSPSTTKFQVSPQNIISAGLNNVFNGFSSSINFFSGFKPKTINSTANTTSITNLTRTQNRTQTINATQNQSQITIQKLPNNQQIDKLILQLDFLSITRIIKDVNRTSALLCEQKMLYLNNLIGRIQSAISMRSYAADQLKILISEATRKYNELNAEIEVNNKIINSLNVTQSKNRLKENITKLEGLYAEYNRLDSRSNSLEKEQLKIRQGIAIKRGKSDVERQQLLRHKLIYNEADLIVKQLQRQLKDAINKQLAIKSLQISTQVQIKDIQLQIKNNQENKKIAQLQLKTLLDNNDNFKIAYQNIEVEIDRLRKDISKGTKRQDQILAQIVILEQRIKIQNRKVVKQQLQKLKQMVSTLSSALPSIQSYISYNYYQCLQSNNPLVKGNESSIVFVFALNDFQQYISSSYGIQPDLALLKIKTSEVTLNSVNIMDSSWQNAFGLPFNVLSFASSTDFSFPQDFNCLNPSVLQSGFGIIVGISQKTITIDDTKGGFINLHLSTCSRLETTQFLPTIGQKIFWRGVPIQKTGQFNIYRASCI